MPTWPTGWATWWRASCSWQTHLEKGTRPEVAGFPKSIPTRWRSLRSIKQQSLYGQKIAELDQKITEEAPFKLVKTDPEVGKKLIFGLTQELYLIGRMLNPFMPETSEEN
jgi:methionyl-tRNA synthetase